MLKEEVFANKIRVFIEQIGFMLPILKEISQMKLESLIYETIEEIANVIKDTVKLLENIKGYGVLSKCLIGWIGMIFLQI